MSFLSFQAMSAGMQAAAIAAGAAAVGVLVAMYFLKLKRIRREIPSTFLWKKSIQDMRANSPFQRLRRNLLLFLQLLILLGALAALARPALTASGGEGTTYIVLLDNSASMSATDVSPSRLERGIAQVEKIIADMNRNDAMMLMTFAAHPKVVVTLTDDRNALQAGLRRVSPTDGRTEIDEPLELADALVRTSTKPQIVVISDGAFMRPPAMESINAPVEFVSIGEECENVGITAMNVRRGVDDPSVGQIFASVTNFTSRDVETVCTLKLDGELVDATAVTIAQASSHAAVFKVALDSEAIAEVSVDYSDDLLTDNRAWAILEPPADVDVTIVGDANVFLRRALAAGGRFNVTESAGEPAVIMSGPSKPVFVYDGSAPTSLGPAGYLIFNAAAPAEGFAVEGTINNPVVIDTDSSSPVTAFLDLGDIFVTKAKKMSFPPETKVLVSSDEAPLVALSYAGGARILTVTFDPMESRWPLRISFPMFIDNAVNFLAGLTDGLSSRHATVGEVLLMPKPRGEEKVTVHMPSGASAELAHVGEGGLAFGDTHEAGIYRVEAGEDATTYAVNLISSSESDITPRESLSIGETKVAAVSSVLPKNRELWRFLVMFAFLILVLEWYVYNRRVYI